MSNLLSALRGEIAAAVRGEIQRALREFSSEFKHLLGRAVAGSAPARGGAASEPSGKGLTGKELTELREKHGLSGPGFAKLMGVSTATVYNWQKNNRPVRLKPKSLAGLASLQGQSDASGKGAKSGVSSRGSLTGKNLTALRNKHGLSGPGFAKLMGVSTATVYNWEKNARGIRLKPKAAAAVASLQAHGPSGDTAPARRGRKPGVQAKSKADRMTGKEIAALRNKLGLSAPRFAKLAGVTTASVYNWEKKKGAIRLRGKTFASLTGLQGMSPDQAKQQSGGGKKGRATRKTRKAPVAKKTARSKASPGRPRGRPAKAKAVASAAPAAVAVATPAPVVVESAPIEPQV